MSTNKLTNPLKQNDFVISSDKIQSANNIIHIDSFSVYAMDQNHQQVKLVDYINSVEDVKLGKTIIGDHQEYLSVANNP